MPTTTIVSINRASPAPAEPVIDAVVSITINTIITKIAVITSSITINQAHYRTIINEYDSRKQNLR